MLVTRQNLKGGRPLSGFPITEISGVLAYKIGYCEHCNNSIGIKTTQVREMIDFFGLTELKYRDLLDKFQPKIGIKEWLIRLLGGVPQNPVENF